MLYKKFIHVFSSHELPGKSQAPYVYVGKFPTHQMGNRGSSTFWLCYNNRCNNKLVMCTFAVLLNIYFCKDLMLMCYSIIKKTWFMMIVDGQMSIRQKGTLCDLRNLERITSGWSSQVNTLFAWKTESFSTKKQS